MTHTPDDRATDTLLVGGGLQNGLIALALLDRDPDAGVTLIERGERLGGNHTWSFHEGYLPAAAGPWFTPLVEHRWSRYRVTFPGSTRTVEHPYATISSEHFHRVVSERFAASPNARLLLGTEAAAVDAATVTLADGRTLAGRLVVDARGPDAGAAPHPGDATGYQKFVGLEVRLAEPLADPDTADLMDATVPQDEGFRFLYVLPFGRDRALVEDTYFTNGPELDTDRVRDRVLAYCAARGLRVAAIERQEAGVLPMPWRSAGPIARSPPLVAGFQGGWFHPATGYSVPVALRLALHVAEHAPDDVFGPAYRALAADQERQAHFAHLLNELLFTAAEPEQRWRVFEHFYGLPDDLILRFYGLALSRADRARFFLRRPPRGVSFARAMKVLPAWTLPWRR